MSTDEKLGDRVVFGRPQDVRKALDGIYTAFERSRDWIGNVKRTERTATILNLLGCGLGYLQLARQNLGGPVQGGM
jgi:hypothetical protein